MEKWLTRKQGISFAVAALVFLLSALPARTEDSPPFDVPPRSEILKLRSAVLETTRGTIYFELFPEEAPWHVANFKYLADKGFYRGLTFHLYKPNFLVQGGDPLGTGFGGPGYTLPPEFSNRHHTFGTLGMARKPDVASPRGRPVNPQRRSSGSQFYISLGEAPDMDSRYTIFGKVVGGADILDELRAGDKIENLTVYIREGGR